MKGSAGALRVRERLFDLADFPLAELMDPGSVLRDFRPQPRRWTTDWLQVMVNISRCHRYLFYRTGAEEDRVGPSGFHATDADAADPPARSRAKATRFVPAATKNEN